MRYSKLVPCLALLIAQFALPLAANAAPVGARCGGIIPLQCGPGKFCNYAAGTCGRGDQMGRCAVRPHICPLYVRPVCGCNHKTYSNDCRRMQAGVSKLHDGKC
jgi:hypothetical protein